jgi:hypothetical protein
MGKTEHCMELFVGRSLRIMEISILFIIGCLHICMTIFLTA